MTLEQWKVHVFCVVDTWMKNPKEVSGIELVAKMLDEADQAKQMLREKGYGVTGTGLLETVKEVPRA